LLESSVLDALAIAHKAGQVAAGHAKVANALASGAVIALIHAREAGGDGVRKIAAAAKHEARAAPVTTIGTFASAELDLALARPNVIHAALLSGHASEAVLARWHILDRFRNDSVGERGDEAARTTDPALGS
ncbi:MAG TPA: DNA-binding protein, partial [Rhodoplanes sp.]|nr:DNA-binding protein [Rhodoplanes sp.]